MSAGPNGSGSYWQAAAYTYRGGVHSCEAEGSLTEQHSDVDGRAERMGYVMNSLAKQRVLSHGVCHEFSCEAEGSFAERFDKLVQRAFQK